MLRLILPFLAIGLFANPAQAQTVTITSNITTNTTWGPTGTVVGDVFWVTSSIAVNAGVTLTIEPGVVVKFNTSRGLTVNGKLRAVGTVTDTIVVTSIRDDNNSAGDTNGDGNTTVPGASNWIGITFPAASPDSSLLEYCDIRFAGAGNRGAILFQSSTDSLVNCVIRRSYYGVELQGTSSSVILNTSIEAATQTPITIDFTATPVFDGVIFSSSDNGFDAIGLRGGTLSESATLPIRGATVGVNPITNVTYVLFATVTIGSGDSLTIEPGVVIKPISSSIGFTVNGDLTMNGTVTDSITVTSIHDDNLGLPSDTNNNGSITAPARGNWGRIIYNQGATGSLEFCQLKFGNNSTSQGMVEMTNVDLPISNTLLSDAGHGVTIRGISKPPLNAVAINNCSSTPILMSVSAVPTFTSVTFLANAITALGLIGENIAVDSRLSPQTVAGFDNITYYVMNGFITMLSPAVLTVDPGVVVKFQQSIGGLIIDGALIADGKPDSLIVFTSERDDQFGNPADTNGDGSITTPNTNDWRYIRYTATSDDALSKLDHCRLTYGSRDSGNGWSSILWITSAAPTVTKCFISKGTYGVRFDGNATAVLDSCDINNCAEAPIVMSVLANPTLTNNSFSSNGFNALALLTETLSQDATLKYRPGVGTPPFAYLTTGTITIASGVTLAVEPKVVIKPKSTSTVFVVNGALNIVGGTGADRVVFTSSKDDTHAGDTNADGSATTPVAGNWGRIEFRDTSDDSASVIRNALFQFGGSSGNTAGVITTVSAGPRFAALEFFQNRTAMTFKGNSQPSVDSVTVLNCTNLPIVSSLISNPTFANMTLANNEFTALGILGETVAQDVQTRVRSLGTFSNIDHALAGNVTIAFGATWTIDPGIVIKMSTLPGDPIGDKITIDGALVADGKSDSLIVFTSVRDDDFGGDLEGDGALTQPAPVNWDGIIFNAVSDDAANLMNHCRIRYGGSGTLGGVRIINAGPTFTNSVFTSNQYGVSIEGSSTPTFTSCDFDSSTKSPVRMSLVSNPTFNSVQFLGNGFTALAVVSETIAQDLLWPIRAVAGRQNMPYLVEGSLTIGLGSTVTLQPGLMVKFLNTSSRIRIQRAFVAEGRSQPDSLIIFTSVKDDFYGGDTNNDGNATAPAVGNWRSVEIQGTAIDPEVRFKNCVFRYGGSGTTIGVVEVVNSSPSIDSCLIAFNRVGVSASGASNPTVNGSSIYGNTNFGINNAGASFCIDATGNWWGSSSGPNDASAAGDLCALADNPGSGDQVSDNVDYSGFSTTGIQTALLGDVSLNGEVLAFDASLVLQAVVVAITLSDLQNLVADVSGAGGVTAFDASLILQYVAGIIVAFPAATTAPSPPPIDVLAARAVVEQARGTFHVSLGEPVRMGEAWMVPVSVEGDAPIHALELELQGEGASGIVSVDAAGKSPILVEHRAGETSTLIALASTRPLQPGEVALLRFPASGQGGPPQLTLSLARVNESQAQIGPAPTPTAPALSFLGAPVPNPAVGNVALILGLANREQGLPVTVRVMDIAGRHVRTLLDGTMSAGSHDLVWDLRDKGGRRVPAGVYMIHARVRDFSVTRRLVVIR